ncbi:hypothetical protein KKG83_07670 [Candidatus Micrarchaeota archaeon]|nr:hypothetical protein [Candidatus Micrarchaeota archaeon]MBU2477319.1 hypothetical protein [Candidatus Micrarchaeota archaeon]
MGIKTKLDIDVVQDPIKWKKKLRKYEWALDAYNTGKLENGGGVNKPTVRKPGKQAIKYVVGVLPSKKRDVIQTLFHEAAHAAAFELMRKHGLILIKFNKQTVPYIASEARTGAEALAMSLEMERYSDKPSLQNAVLKEYTKICSKSPVFEEHRLGLKLAKAILAVAPYSLADRRLLREKTAEFIVSHKASLLGISNFADQLEAKKGKSMLKALRKRAAVKAS